MVAPTPPIAREIFRRVAITPATGFAYRRDQGNSHEEISLRGLHGSNWEESRHTAPAASSRAASLIDRIHAGEHGEEKTTAASRRQAQRSEHRHESAEAFGFLERRGNAYVPGPYLRILTALEALSANDTGYDIELGRRAIYLHALLSKHGDMVVPVLAQLEESGPGEAVDFDRLNKAVGTILKEKCLNLRDSALPTGANTHAVRSVAEQAMISWTEEHDKEFRIDRRIRGAAREKILLDTKNKDEKGNWVGTYNHNVKQGYISRSRRYLKDLDLVSNDNSFTEAGQNLVDSLKAEGFFNPRLLSFNATFEAVRDALSLPWITHNDAFKPTTRALSFERIVSATLSQGSQDPWQAHEQELLDRYRQMISLLGDVGAGSVRLDVLRLALHVDALVRAQPVDLETQDEEDPNANAVVVLAKNHPSEFHLGHARNGGRFWSVTPTR